MHESIGTSRPCRNGPFRRSIKSSTFSVFKIIFYATLIYGKYELHHEKTHTTTKWSLNFSCINGEVGRPYNVYLLTCCAEISHSRKHVKTGHSWQKPMDIDIGEASQEVVILDRYTAEELILQSFITRGWYRRASKDWHHVYAESWMFSCTHIYR